MMTRATDADAFNAVVNDPSVRPFVGWPELGVLDLSAVVADERHVLLVNDWGGFLCVELAPRIYDVHVAFLPAGRGRRMITAAMDALEWMFVHDAEVLMLHPLPERGHLVGLASALGFVLSPEKVYHMTRRQFLAERAVCQSQSH